MPVALDHAQIVLAGILPNRKDHLLYALQKLEPEHFRQEPQRIVFTLLERFWDVGQGVMPRSVLEDVLQRYGVEVTKSLLYESMFDQLVEQQVSDTEFRWSVDGLIQQRSEQLTGEAITASFEILEHGLTVGQTPMKGHREAREFLMSELARIDKLGGVDDAPEGDMRHDTDALLNDYAERKAGKLGQGIRTGIENLDAVTSGLQNGELVLIPGFTGHGKTQFVSQLAWHCCVLQGKSVFFATSETLRLQIERRIMARHSRQLQFNRPKGINSAQIKNGTLSDADEQVYKDALHDFKNNPTYGQLYIAQVPRGASLSFLEARLRRQSQTQPYDLVIIDYLALLKPDVRRNSEREEFNAMLRDAKVMATTYMEGRGVPVVSPWAVSRTAWQAAINTGEYELGSLADTSEAEKSSDLIISLLRKDETINEVDLKILKNRDGAVPPQIPLQVDYRNSYLGENEAGAEALGSAQSDFAAALWGSDAASGF